MPRNTKAKLTNEIVAELRTTARLDPCISLYDLAHKYGFSCGTMSQWLLTAGFQHRLIASRALSYEVRAIATPGDK